MNNCIPDHEDLQQQIVSILYNLKSKLKTEEMYKEIARVFDLTPKIQKFCYDAEGQSGENVLKTHIRSAFIDLKANKITCTPERGVWDLTQYGKELWEDGWNVENILPHREPKW